MTTAGGTEWLGEGAAHSRCGTSGGTPGGSREKAGPPTI
jgi:hypothetical protein